MRHGVLLRASHGSRAAVESISRYNINKTTIRKMKKLLLFLTASLGLIAAPGASASLVTINGTCSGTLDGAAFDENPFVWSISFTTDNPYLGYGKQSPVYTVSSSQLTLNGGTPLTVSTAIGDSNAATGMGFNFVTPGWTGVFPMSDDNGNRANLLSAWSGDTWDGVTDFFSSFINYSGVNLGLTTSGGFLDYSGTVSSVEISGMSAIPEPTSVLGTMGLLTSGLLLRRRTKHLR